MHCSGEKLKCYNHFGQLAVLINLNVNLPVTQILHSYMFIPKKQNTKKCPQTASTRMFRAVLLKRAKNFKEPYCDRGMNKQIGLSSSSGLLFNSKKEGTTGICSSMGSSQRHAEWKKWGTKEYILPDDNVWFHLWSSRTRTTRLWVWWSETASGWWGDRGLTGKGHVETLWSNRNVYLVW